MTKSRPMPVLLRRSLFGLMFLVVPSRLLAGAWPFAVFKPALLVLIICLAVYTLEDITTLLFALAAATCFAWLAYYPLLGIPAFFVTVFLTVLSELRISRDRAASALPAPPPKAA